MYYTLFDTPAGTLLLLGNGQLITGIHWTVFKRAPVIIPQWTENKRVFKDVIEQLEEYFAGTRMIFDFPYEATGTDFQKAVWRELEKLSYGVSSSYQAIATAVGRPRAVRAVGTAIGSNPLSIVVPCHRVLTSSKMISGYAGGVTSKMYLLDRENISFIKSTRRL